jgi:hypothetical protein
MMDRLQTVMRDPGWLLELYVQQSSFWEQPLTYRGQLTAGRLASRYRTDLQQVFSHVSEYAIMTNSRGGPIYALVLASHREPAARIMSDIMAKYQLLRL